MEEAGCCNMCGKHGNQGWECGCSALESALGTKGLQKCYVTAFDSGQGVGLKFEAVVVQHVDELRSNGFASSMGYAVSVANCLVLKVKAPSGMSVF